MTVLDPQLLQLGLVLTVLVLVGLWSHDRRRRKLAEFLGGRRAVRRVARFNLYRLRIERAVLLGVGGVALAGAAAEPSWLGAPEPEPATNSVVLAMDVSASMQASDVPPTRLAHSTEVARELLEGLADHRVGLMLFAGTAYPLAPPTHDHDALRFLLEGLTPTIASQYDPGTLISVGLAEAVTLLERPSVVEAAGGRGSRSIVLVGDGETGTLDTELEAALDSITARGITVHTVGVGTDQGAGMIMPAGTYQVGGPVLDANGGRAVARLREPLLQQIASEGGGRYVHVDATSELQSLQAELLDPGEEPLPDPVDAPPPWARYDLPFLLGCLALVLLVIESLLDVTLPRFRRARAVEAT